MQCVKKRKFKLKNMMRKEKKKTEDNEKKKPQTIVM